jgi:hypothetical protein
VFEQGKKWLYCFLLLIQYLCKLYVFATPWSLFMNSRQETMDHSVCLYITMVSFHQFSARDHESLYLYIITPLSLLTNFLHKTMNPFLCLSTPLPLLTSVMH